MRCKTTWWLKLVSFTGLPLFLLGAIIFVQARHRAFIARQAALSISASKAKFSLHEPVSLQVTIANKSNTAFYVFLDSGNTIFSCRATDAISSSLVQEIPAPSPGLIMGFIQASRIDPHSAIHFDVYLNAYLKFRTAGQVSLQYELTIPVYREQGAIGHGPDFILTEQKSVTLEVEKFDSTKVKENLLSTSFTNVKTFDYRPYISTFSDVPLPLLIQCLPAMLSLNRIHPGQAIEIAATSSCAAATKVIKSTLPSK